MNKQTHLKSKDMAVLEVEDRNFLTLQFQLLRKAICDQISAESLEARPVCVTIEADCYRAYNIYSVTADGTTLLRTEDTEGVVIADPVFVECTDECLYILPEE